MNSINSFLDLDFRTCINECELNGERFIYDGCSTSSLEDSKKFYDKYGWIYIYSGYRTWHNGVENNWKEKHHFFIRSNRIKEIRNIKLKKLNYTLQGVVKKSNC